MMRHGGLAKAKVTSQVAGRTKGVEGAQDCRAGVPEQRTPMGGLRHVFERPRTRSHSDGRVAGVIELSDDRMRAQQRRDARPSSWSSKLARNCPDLRSIRVVPVQLTAGYKAANSAATPPLDILVPQSWICSSSVHTTAGQTSLSAVFQNFPSALTTRLGIRSESESPGMRRTNPYTYTFELTRNICGSDLVNGG